MIMKNEFICNDVLVVHLTVSQIKAIIESALKEAHYRRTFKLKC